MSSIDPKFKYANWFLGSKCPFTKAFLGDYRDIFTTILGPEGGEWEFHSFELENMSLVLTTNQDWMILSKLHDMGFLTKYLTKVTEV